ncbi:hypothetical protein ZIOFF_022607 [Zingiber officinale]|uniref:Uncharacterized protein n=1 Tax=Zingiber officinale TaxID=94328 RepID=A0A8J5H357_ZINOF|nr:hypothetical protein ZIOFF_022607 [Zingiber officinale]
MSLFIGTRASDRARRTLFASLTASRAWSTLSLLSGGSVIRLMSPFTSFLYLLIRVSSYLLPHEDVVVEISEHELVIIVEEFGCLLARVFDVILGLFVDCLNIFSTLGHSPAIEISYPGLDRQLFLRCTVVGFLLVLCRLKYSSEMANECCSIQLIDGDSVFNVTGLEHFMKSVKLAEHGLSYAVVSIVDPQSSGTDGRERGEICLRGDAETV